MKRIFFLIFITVVIIIPLFSQADFSGSADITFVGNIPESESYNSTLNPGNVFGIKDFAIAPSLIAKLDAGDESTSFSAWFFMKEYPVGQGLLAAAYLDPAQTGAVYELVSGAGDTLYSFDLMRLSANVYLTDTVSLEIGRQSMLTGYGYGWNPIDFANPLKNPADPDADLRGVDAVTLKFYPGNSASVKVYALTPKELLSSGLDYEEIKAGGEAVFYLPGFELRLAGFWDYDSTEGSDPYTPVLGSAFMADLFGIGVYGEAALRKGSRNFLPDGVTRDTDWLISGLAGIEYTFGTELYAVLEYFYNGEGFSKEERSAYKDTLQTYIGSYGAPSSSLLTMYTPGYFAEHYILLNLMQPLYDINTTLNLSVLYSPDSGALTLMPSMDYSFSGNFSVNLAYTGMFDLGSNDFNEITALPVRHIVSSVFTYSY